TEPNAFHAIRAAVTRNVYHEDFYKVEKLQDPDDPKYLLNPDERVTVKDMVKAYTVNAAYALHLEDEIGSLEIGKKADTIVIDRDVFNTPSLEISDIKVIRTVFDGKIVYERA
ncbi:MAG: amidohydrolase family protein, partial [Anaerovoracaceae bacterium]|nr:amidohydrolase family protein [Anaerovoracaceae bacterium]